jgi:xylose isomerase
MAKSKTRRLIRVEVELSCAPGTTKIQAKREMRERVNDPYFAFRDIDVRMKRAK